MHISSNEGFHDQSSFNQVREALWHWPQSRASVLVGSGFSRNALKRWPGVEDIPTWAELGLALERSLSDGSGGRAGSVENEVPKDPLKLAQEYDDSFGRSALHRFIREQVRDTEFEPGQLHRRLLELPWRDVFTTNWDTLLERCAAEQVRRGYSVLERTRELPLELPPRIVKLHGSLPHGYPLISTEEDYRTYPARFAPFVNVVQQSMMETTMLLLGFSGDDPNFLRWLGWVRDNLGEAAPKIYLAGWLGLRPSRRRSLELRNVVPVDLALHPNASSWGDSKYLRAMEWLLLSLERWRTYELQKWPEPDEQEEATPRDLRPIEEVKPSAPRKDRWPELVPSELESGSPEEQRWLQEIREITDVWRHNRECYPDWLVLPFEVAGRMRATTDAWEKIILRLLSGLGDAASRLEVLSELVWRREALLDPLFSDVEPKLLEVFDEIDCEAKTIAGERRDDLDWTAVTAQWRMLALYLVTAARHDFDREEFERRVRRLEPLLARDHDLRQRLHHEECLWALNRQELEQLESLLKEWGLKEEDHAWRLRKAALLVELDRKEDGLQLVRRVLRAVRGWRDGDPSMAGPSLEAWALWLEHLLDGEHFTIYDGFREFLPYRCDLLGDMSRLKRAVVEEGSEKKAKPFGLGATPGRTVVLSSTRGRRAAAALRAVRFSEMVGVPTSVVRTLRLRVGADLLGAAAGALRPYSPEWAAWLTARCADTARDARLGRLMSRSRMAFLPLALVEDLAEAQLGQIQQFVEHVPPKRGGGAEFWCQRLEVGMEVLSRCVVRLGSEKAEEVLDLAASLYCDPRVTEHLRFWGPLGHLVRRAWEALPGSVQSQHALRLLSLPIVGLDGFSVDDPVAGFREPAWLMKRAPGGRSYPVPGRSEENEEQWRVAIDLVDRGLKSGGEARKRAGARLARMAPWRRFTASEEQQLAASLWGPGWHEDEELPKGAGINPWVFLDLPEPQAGIALERLRAPWSRPRDWQDVGQEPLEEFLSRAGSTLGDLQEGGIDMVLSEREVGVLRAAVEQWAELDLGPVRSWMFDNTETRWRATRAVSRLLLRFKVSEGAALSLGERVKRLSHEEVPAYELVPGILNSGPEQVESLAWELRLGLAATASKRLLSAVHGLFLWLEAGTSEEPALPPVPAALLQEIGVIIVNRRWEALARALEVAGWVFREGTSDQQDLLRASVLEGLGRLRQELVYEEDVDPHPFIKRPWVDHEEVDVPLLRWRCAQTAHAMNAAGLGDESAVETWLKVAEEDPLPEVRFVSELWEVQGSGENGEEPRV